MTSYGNRSKYMLKQLMKDHGISMTFRRGSNDAYDPSTGSAAASTNDDETVLVALVDYSRREIDNSTIEVGDRKALFSAFQTNGNALSKTPQHGDKLIGEGDTVRIISVETTKMGSNVVGYICQVRE